jgi:hypothetical protein
MSNPVIRTTTDAEGNPIEIVHKIVAGRYDLFDTIAPGDKIETWDGVTGTVAAFVPTYSHHADGTTNVITGADVLIYVDRLPYGYRPTKAVDMQRHVRKFSSELYMAYTVRPAA